MDDGGSIATRVGHGGVATNPDSEPVASSEGPGADVATSAQDAEGIAPADDACPTTDRGARP